MDQELESFVHLLNKNRAPKPVSAELAHLPTWAQRALSKTPDVPLPPRPAALNGNGHTNGATNGVPEPRIEPTLTSEISVTPPTTPVSPTPLAVTSAIADIAKESEPRPLRRPLFLNGLKPGKPAMPPQPPPIPSAPISLDPLPDAVPRDELMVEAKVEPKDEPKTAPPPDRIDLARETREQLGAVPALADMFSTPVALEPSAADATGIVPAPVASIPDAPEILALTTPVAEDGNADPVIVAPIADAENVIALPVRRRRPLAYVAAAAAVVAAVTLVAGGYWYYATQPQWLRADNDKKPAVQQAKLPVTVAKTGPTAKPMKAPPGGVSASGGASIPPIVASAPKQAPSRADQPAPKPSVAIAPSASPQPQKIAVTPAPAPKPAIAAAKPVTPKPEATAAKAAVTSKPEATAAKAATAPKPETVAAKPPTPPKPEAVAAKPATPTKPDAVAAKPPVVPKADTKIAAIPPPAPPSVIPPTKQASASPPPAKEAPLQQIAMLTPPPAPPPSEAKLPLEHTAGEPTWLRNALPAPANVGQPQIAIVIDDLGLDRNRTQRAIALKGPVTLSFLAYASDLPVQTEAARQAGHELIVHIPMEPIVRPKLVSGGTGGTDTTRDELLRRLRWDLGRFNGYVGVNNHMGNRLATDQEAARTVIAELKARGLLFLDSHGSTGGAVAVAERLGVPTVSRDIFLDDDVGAGSVVERLEAVEKLARERGTAIAIGHPHDQTLEALARWIATLQAKGLQLVPLTAIVKDRDQHLAGAN